MAAIDRKREKERERERGREKIRIYRNHILNKNSIK
jgi:hypothetical protein